MASQGRGKGKDVKAISDKIIKSDFIKWRELEIIQPSGFKELSKSAYQKLRNSLIENNFVESFKVWEHGKIYLLDGVHRCKVLDILDSEGYDIPDKFRADFIECKDRKQAKKMILVYSSRYAKLLEEGLYEFAQDLNWGELTQTIDLPDIDLEIFAGGFLNDSYTEDFSLRDGDKEPYQQMTFTLHDSQVEIVKQAIKNVNDHKKSDVNENSNGNALAYICEEFIEQG